MKLRISGIFALAALAVVCLFGSAQSRAQNAYITANGSDTVSVVDTATNTVIATIPVGVQPAGVAVSADGSKVYVANQGTGKIPGSVSVIDSATNTATATIPLGLTGPGALAVTPDDSKVYVTDTRGVSVIATATNAVTGTILVAGPGNLAVSPDGNTVYVTGSSGVSVIDAATNTVIATIPVGGGALAVTPDGSKVYLTSSGGVSVIATASNTVIATIPVDGGGLAVTPDGSKVYIITGHIASGAGTVSVIDTATNTVTATIPVGPEPTAVAVTPDSSKVYVADFSDSVWVIDTTTNTVANTIYVFEFPVGVAIQPLFTVSPSEVATTASGLAYSRVSKTFNGTVTLTNISSSAVSGPFQMVFTGLPAGVTLANATGEFSGSPYLTITVASVSPGGTASLMPGQSATASVQFDDPSFAAIKFTPLIYSGSL
jgi:YVTN family beta-propeller protein